MRLLPRCVLATGHKMDTTLDAGGHGFWQSPPSSVAVHFIPRPAMLAGVGGEWGSVGDLISQSCRSKMRRETSIPHVVLVCTYGVSAVYHSPGSIGQGLTSADPSGLDGILQTDPWVFWRSGLLRLNARPRAMATTNPRLLDCRFPPAQHHPWYQARHIATAISQ